MQLTIELPDKLAFELDLLAEKFDMDLDGLIAQVIERGLYVDDLSDIPEKKSEAI